MISARRESNVTVSWSVSAAPKGTLTGNALDFAFLGGKTPDNFDLAVQVFSHKGTNDGKYDKIFILAQSQCMNRWMRARKSRMQTEQREEIAGFTMMRMLQ